jgi:hypothetical protein
VVDRVNPSANAYVGGRASAFTRVHRIPDEISEHLSQQHFVAQHVGKRTVDGQRYVRREFVAQVVGGPPDDEAEIDTRQGDVLRAGEAEEIRDDLSERLRFLSDAFNVPAVIGLESFNVDQLAVAVDGREAVAEFVGETSRELTEPRQRFLETQLLLELDVRSEKRQMTPGAASGGSEGARAGGISG